MGKYTPTLNRHDKAEYIRAHLFNELRWLLGAATEWSVQEQLKLEIVGYDVRVYAMDSAFLHARTLFEFFVHLTNDNHYGCDAFIGSVLTSDSYRIWKGPLHSFLMHAQDRSRPTPLRSSGVAKPLNKLPVDFANEILRLWREFEKALGNCKNVEDQELQKLACDRRKEAILLARYVVNSPVAQQHASSKKQILTPVSKLIDDLR